jgi:hypothetical protein
MESHSGLFSDGIVRMGIHSDSFSDGIVRMGIQSDAFSDGIVRMGIHSDAFSDGIARMHAIENACATMRSHAALTTAPEELARTHEDRKESLGITRARRRHATPRHATPEDTLSDRSPISEATSSHAPTRSFASHARTKRNDFPVGLTPPTSDTFLHGFVACSLQSLCQIFSHIPKVFPLLPSRANKNTSQTSLSRLGGLIYYI